MSSEKFYLDQDDDSHWYIVPLRLKTEFDKFVADPENVDMPSEVETVNGPPNCIVFGAWEDTRG